MYACAERDRTKNQRINRKYKGTEGASGERGGSDLKLYGETGETGAMKVERRRMQQVTRDEG